MRTLLAIGLVVVAVIGIGALAMRMVAGRQRAAAPPIALVSASIALPEDSVTLPAGPHVDLVTARCTACHSAEMILSQPGLSPDQWQATVTKMREAYKADVPASDEPAILAYLTRLSAAKAAPQAKERS